MKKTAPNRSSSRLEKMKREMMKAVRTTPLFHSLSDEEWRDVVQYLHGHTYPEDAYLFFQGDPPDALYIIWKGRVKLVRHTSQGRDVVVTVLGPGQLIGEMAIFDGRPYSMSAIALEDTAVVTISRHDLMAIIQRHPAVSFHVILELNRRLRLCTELVRSLAVDRVEQRIARALLRLMDLGGTPAPEGEGIMIDIHLTRQDIAEMTGTTVETAIRVMSRFRKEGLIRNYKGRTILLDPERLEKIARGK
ncbi:MAG TPA: Crp/Fnr family transcriptional regulator [Anaerolineae bacterium]|nr:Crp/Fnr family transcriptional regulator [Anaerolineae bacterium]